MTKALKPLTHPVVCIVGPTASGKTLLAQKVAERLGAAVLSADSMQIYTGMDIGTGKIPVEERTVAYYGLDIASFEEAYSVQRFQAYGREVIESLDTAGQPCVVCGGTGLYVRALIDDFNFPAGEQVGNAVRDKYMALAAQEGPQAVWELLRDRDRASADIIPVQDTKRVIRALELLEEGTSYAQQKEAFATIPQYYPATFIGLHVDPDILRQRIDARVDMMIEQGLIDEVHDLVYRGLGETLTARAAIGYSEIATYLDGKLSLEEALEHIKIATHQYAKRQRTWFRKDTRIQWLDANDLSDERVAKLTQIVLDAYAQSCGVEGATDGA